MTGLHLAIAIAVTTVTGLLLWTAVVRAQTRITPDDLPYVPVGVTTRVCDSASCCGRTPHVVLPSGAALCATCGAENPAPHRAS